MARIAAWQGVDDPGRIDRAVLDVGPDRMRGHGTSTTDAYALSWRLDVGSGWITRALEVAVHGASWSRSLLLERAADGEWRATAHAVGSTALPTPGLADPQAVAGALDCDLGLCPVTNTMPIRRLRMLERDAAPAPILAAWVEVPSLRVVGSVQHYARLDGGRVEYASASRDFVAALEVDPDGVVVDYPGLAAPLGPR